jgi:hypothetical protein
MNLKTGKTSKRALILAKQLEKASLSLVITKKEKIIIMLKNEYTICRLVFPRVQDERTQIIKITC